MSSQSEFDADDAERRASLVRSVRRLVDRAVVDSGSLSGEATWGGDGMVPNYPGIERVDRVDVRFETNGAGLDGLRAASRRLDHLVAESLRYGDLSDAAFANVTVTLYDDDGRAVQVMVIVGR
jgi:hypothetical protein